MGWLGVKHHLFGVVIELEVLQFFSLDLEHFHHGNITQSPDLVRITDGNALYPIAQKTFDGHGTSQSIRISIDDHQDIIILLKNIPELPESFFCRIPGSSTIPAILTGFFSRCFQKLNTCIKTLLHGSCFSTKSTS